MVIGDSTVATLSDAARAGNWVMWPPGVFTLRILKLDKILQESKAKRFWPLILGCFPSRLVLSPPPPNHPSLIHSETWLVLLGPQRKLCLNQSMSPWQLWPNSTKKDPNANKQHIFEAPSPASWKLLASPSSCCPPPSAAIVDSEENRTAGTHLVSSSTTQTNPSHTDMAFQRADPEPFIPEQMQHEDIPNHVFMVHAVAPARPPAKNEDFAIVTFDPLPGNALHFGAVRRVIRDFLRLEKRVAYEDIQPTHLGQALVRFTHAYDRDTLVQESPHVYDNVNVTFCKHDEGRNWRRAQFNHDYWLILLGFPNDYWSEKHIQNALGTFAKVLLWEADDRLLTRLLVRAKVKDVEKVPHFIVYEDPHNVDGESWTIQCEVLKHKPQDEGPPEENPIPENLDLEISPPYDFFGLGQPINGQNAEQNQGQNQGAWNPWLADLQSQNQQMQEQPMQMDLNEVPVHELKEHIDPNQPLRAGSRPTPSSYKPCGASPRR